MYEKISVLLPSNEFSGRGDVPGGASPLNPTTRREKKLANTSATAVTAEQIKVILSDILRAELNRIIDAQNAGEPIGDEELDLQIQSRTDQGDDMGPHARRNDFRLVDQMARK